MIKKKKKIEKKEKIWQMLERLYIVFGKKDIVASPAVFLFFSFLLFLFYLFFFLGGRGVRVGFS